MTWNQYIRIQPLVILYYANALLLVGHYEYYYFYSQLYSMSCGSGNSFSPHSKVWPIQTLHSTTVHSWRYLNELLLRKKSWVIVLSMVMSVQVWDVGRYSWHVLLCRHVISQWILKDGGTFVLFPISEIQMKSKEVRFRRSLGTSTLLRKRFIKKFKKINDNYHLGGVIYLFFWFLMS